MISATSNPKFWRVEFDQQHSDRLKSTVVCFVQITETGAKIFYSHHVPFSRQVEGAPWARHPQVQNALNHALRALIEIGVWEALWESIRDPQDAVQEFPSYGSPSYEKLLGDERL
jgi:hypothetical protein